MKFVSQLYLVMVLCLCGCASMESTRSPGAFVRSVDVSQFDTFICKEAVLSGSAFREFEEVEIKEISNLVLSEALAERGFSAVESQGDFYAVAKWHKGLSSYAGLFDSVDGPSSTMNRRNNSKSSTAVRVRVTVEVYETATNQLFWRAELPNIFDAIQYTEERVTLSLSRAIKDFPNRSRVR